MNGSSQKIESAVHLRAEKILTDSLSLFFFSLLGLRARARVWGVRSWLL
jgi:hypothetical protein